MGKSIEQQLETAKLEIDSLRRQRDLLRLSVNGLIESSAKHKRRAEKRLLKVKELQKQVAEYKAQGLRRVAKQKLTPGG